MTIFMCFCYLLRKRVHLVEKILTFIKLSPDNIELLFQTWSKISTNMFTSSSAPPMLLLIQLQPSRGSRALLRLLQQSSWNHLLLSYSLFHLLRIKLVELHRKYWHFEINTLKLNCILLFSSSSFSKDRNILWLETWKWNV